MRIFYTVIIFVLLLVVLFLVNLIFSSDNKRINNFYYNEYVIIKNKDLYISGNKPANYKNCKSFTVCRIKDTTMYTEINQENFLYKDNRFWDSLNIACNINDTLHFKYIRKSRFFKIINKKNNGTRD